MESDYSLYRGKCKEMSEELIKQDNTLTLVRGFYYDPVWGQEAHWWTKKPDGTIVDPTKDQFPSKGSGVYEEFDGIVHCSNCGKEMLEEDAQFDSNYVFCSYICHGQFVGVM